MTPPLPTGKPIEVVQALPDGSGNYIVAGHGGAMLMGRP